MSERKKPLDGHEQMDARAVPGGRPSPYNPLSSLSDKQYLRGAPPIHKQRPTGKARRDK